MNHPFHNDLASRVMPVPPNEKPRAVVALTKTKAESRQTLWHAVIGKVKVPKVVESQAQHMEVA